MTLMRSPKPLGLKFRPSRLLYGYFVGVHGLAVMGLYLLVPPFVAVVLMVLLLFSAGFYIYRDVYFLHYHSLGHIAFADNRWRIFRGDVRHSSTLDAQQVDWLDAVVLPFAVVLRFRLLSGRVQSVLVLPDHLDAHQYRKLRQIANFARIP